MKHLRTILAALLIAVMSLPSAAALAENTVKITGDEYVRVGPDLSYDSIGVVYKGRILSYDKTQSDSRGVMWYHIVYKGKQGWVSSKYAK